MRLIIDINEKYVYKYGVIIIDGVSPDAASPVHMTLPGFKYGVPTDNDGGDTFMFTKSYDDQRDLESLLNSGGIKNEQTDGTEGANGGKDSKSDVGGEGTKSGTGGHEYDDREPNREYEYEEEEVTGEQYECEEENNDSDNASN